jgi:hypothetical protein
LAYVADYSGPTQKLLSRIETKWIIDYIKKHPGTTMDKVATYLQKEKICSRLSTMAIIEKLLYTGLIKDDRKGKYFHSLYYNEDFDFNRLGINLLLNAVKEIHKDYNHYGSYSDHYKHNRMFERIYAIINEVNAEIHKQDLLGKKTEQETEQKKPKAKQVGASIERRQKRKEMLQKVLEDADEI